MLTHLYISLLLGLYIAMDAFRNLQVALMRSRADASTASRIWHPISSALIVAIAVVPSLVDLPIIDPYSVLIYGSVYWLFHEVATNIGNLNTAFALGDGVNDFPNNYIKSVAVYLGFKPEVFKAFIHVVVILVSCLVYYLKPF